MGISCGTFAACAKIGANKKESDRMGLVTRRSEQLDRLFDQFAIDPKKKRPTDKSKDQQKEKQEKGKN